MLARSVLTFLLLLAICHGVQGAPPPADPLAVGVAGHAFDHLGEFADQADAAAASGANVIYATGLGAVGYTGLPPAPRLDRDRAAFSAYLRDARDKGVRLAIGYVCATSIVKLDTFDKNWSDEFRASFSTPPSQWLQQDADGQPLASWYGGDYRPACMNNPDWRNYEEQIVALQLDAGCDGVFFDNPTVHPKGCYCPYCMKKFAAFLGKDAPPADASVAQLRRVPASRPADFLRFRATIAADFLADLRAHARKTHPNALITANNSLNSPDAFFSQIRTYGYSIADMSRSEDLIVVEDMATQPRVMPSGSPIEYGPVYELLRAIAHGKPIVACTLADGDYHTPPNLMRLAMAEAAAHGASYMSWPTWPKEQRDRMAAGVRPQADFLAAHADLLNGVEPLVDAVLLLPYERWVQTPQSRAVDIARALARENVQFRVVSEEDLNRTLESRPDEPAAEIPALIVESADVLTDAQRRAVTHFQAAGGRLLSADQPDWLAHVPRSAVVENAPDIRVVARRQAGKTILHLLNLNVQRIDSFDDRATPATDVRLRLHLRPGSARPRSISALTADPDASHGPLPFTAGRDAAGPLIRVTIPSVQLSTILVTD